MPRAHLLAGKNRFPHVIPSLQELHWLPVTFCAQFKVLVIITYEGNNYSWGLSLRNRLTLRIFAQPL